MAEKIREEVINVVIAHILKKKGLDLVIPETIGRKKRPDIIVGLYGLTFLIEGRNENLRKSLFKDTRKKLEEGYGDVGMAILYSEDLYKVEEEIGELEIKIEKSHFSGAVFYWTSEGIKHISFYNKKVKDIIELIREILDIYVKNDILRQQVQEVQNSLERVVKTASKPALWFSDKELKKRLLSALGVSDYGKEEKSQKS